MEKKVLVVDDEQIVLDSVNKILAEADYEIHVSLSGRRGLDMAIKNQYDIVLSNIRMPDISGMRVLRDVKRAKPSIPVVIITGYGSVQSAVQAMKLGATDYLEKPFTPDQLLKTISSAIDVAAVQTPEEQALIHKEEVIKMLDKVVSDLDFVAPSTVSWVDTLDQYNLTKPEKLALVTGDIEWIEKHVGPLTSPQKQWLEDRMKSENW